LSTPIPAYEALAADIKALGTTAVFGLMSDDTALFVATLDAMGVRFYGARHENNAIAMAEGYSSATGGLAIAIIGRGPAAANAMHGANYVLRAGSRVLLIFGDTANTAAQPNALGPDTKLFPCAAMLQTSGIKTMVASDPLTARRTLAQAIGATHQGTVALLLPMNVQFALIDPEATQPPPVADLSLPRKAARPAAIKAAAALLADSRKPLIVAGLGAFRAGARDALVRLGDHLGAGLGTTLKAKDLFRGHPFDCGVLGSFSHGGGRRLIEQADCVIAFGAGMNMRTTSYGLALPPDVPLIHVDSRRDNIGRWFPADVAVVADATLAAEQLIAAVPPRDKAAMPLRSPELQDWLASYTMEREFKPEPTPRTMDPRSLGLELNRLLPENRNAVFDSGNFLLITPYISVPGPGHTKQSSDFSSIGMGFGTALGFAVGAPDRPTVLFIGDGSFLMTMGELETVVREDIPLIVVLMNDCAYGAEMHYLKMRNMAVNMSVFPDIDYAPIAAGFGFQAETVRTLDELRKLAPMLAKPEGPIFLDCKINGQVPASFISEAVEFERRKSKA